MARQKISRVIDGVEYTVTQLGALKNREVLIRLSKTAGPIFKALQSNDVAGALEAVNESELAFLCDTFSPLTEYRVGDKRPQLDRHFDDHFAGDHFPAMFKWLLFCLEINYASFFGGADRIKSAVSKWVANAVAATETTGESSSS